MVTLHDSGTNLSTNSKLGPASLNRYQVVGFHHAGFDSFYIKGSDGA